LGFTRLRGFQDLIGSEARAVALVEERARIMAVRYNLDEIRIPMMERIDLYQRSTGETSDIVTKQMYVVKRSEESGGADEMILRPEGTPGVIRAYIESGLDKRDPYQRYFYSGPMLRYERPQKGRYRQFHQFGVEILGRADAACDAELMIMIDDLMRDLGLEVRFKINSLGHDRPDCRPLFKAALLEYGRSHFDELCVDCRARLERNPLRLLDCKIDAERVARSAPKSSEFLCEECRSHFNMVQRILSEASVLFDVEPSLVRGLDYYTRTAFEVVSSVVGRSQNALAAGGRYDGLVKELGGTAIPGVGFAIGVERTALALQTGNFKPRKEPDLALAGLGEGPNLVVMKIAHELREKNLRVEVLPSDRKPRAALTIADRMGASHAAIVGEDELTTRIVRVRDLKHGTQQEIALDQLVSHFAGSGSSSIQAFDDSNVSHAISYGAGNPMSSPIIAPASSNTAISSLSGNFINLLPPSNTFVSYLPTNMWSPPPKTSVLRPSSEGSSEPEAPKVSPDERS
jgi:histidyl-tRNA synthetase